MYETPQVNEFVKQNPSSGNRDLLSTVSDWFKNRTIQLIGAALGGLLLGMILAWGVWPVKWVDASADLLRADLQQEWVRMVADSYALGVSDEATAAGRLQALGESAETAVAAVQSDLESTDPRTQSALAELMVFYTLRLGYTDPETGLAVETGENAPDEGAAAENTEMTNNENTNAAASPAVPQKSKTTLWFGLSCMVLLIFGGAVAYFFLRKPKEEDGLSPSLMAQDISLNAERSDFDGNDDDKPIAQWVTTYMKGDDLFDDSFPIDTGIGEFLGECGVGIAETIGVGEPKRVSALEVWMFDKNDIQTVTKVLMSEHLFSDDANRNRLAAKGEPVLLQPKAQIGLETETLQLIVRILDMQYGGGALPDKSYLEQISLELSVWPK